MHKFRSLLAILAILAASVGVEAVADPAVLKFSEYWQYDMSVLFFAPTSTTGTSTIAGRTVNLDLDLGDALDLLDFEASGRFEAWKGDWGLLVGANYLSLSEEQTIIPPGPVGAGLNVKAETTQKWMTLMAGYRVASGTYGNFGRPFSFDVQGGARYNSLKQTVALTGC